MQLWELSKSTASLLEKLSAQETEEDRQQGCSIAEACSNLFSAAASLMFLDTPHEGKNRSIWYILFQVARLLGREAAEKTGAGQQRRKEVLERGGLEQALQRIRSTDAAVMEACAGDCMMFLSN